MATQPIPALIAKYQTQLADLTDPGSYAHTTLALWLQEIANELRERGDLVLSATTALASYGASHTLQVLVEGKGFFSHSANAALVVDNDTVFAAADGGRWVLQTAGAAELQTLSAGLQLRAPLLSPALTGTPTAPTAPAATNTTQVATTAFVQSITAPQAATLAQLATDIASKAPLASPALTGTPTAPTPAAGTSTTQLATTAFVQGAVAPLSTQVGNLSSALAAKADLASPALTGTPTAPTPAAGTNTTQVATTAFVQGALSPVATQVSSLSAALAQKADLLSPALTGTPTAPTAAAGNNTTQVATTAFVQGAVAPLSTQVSSLSAALAQKADLASPALSGTPTAPTAAAGTSTTQVATTAFVQGAVAPLSDEVDTLAAALALKADLLSPALTGTPTAPTAAAGANTTQLATTAFVQGAVSPLSASIALRAPLASPALTGTPTAPTAAAGNNTTQLATTAFVQNAVAGISSGGGGAATMVRTTIAALKASVPSASIVYYVADAGREGHFVLDGTDTTSTDLGGGDGGLVIVCNGGQRVKRVLEGNEVRLDWYPTLTDYRPVLEGLWNLEYTVVGTQGKTYPSADNIQITDKNVRFLGNNCTINVSGLAIARNFVTHTQSANPAAQIYVVESLVRDPSDDRGHILIVNLGANANPAYTQGDTLHIWAQQPVHPTLDGGAAGRVYVAMKEYIPVHKSEIVGGKLRVYFFNKLAYRFSFVDYPLTYVRVSSGASATNISTTAPGATIDGTTMVAGDRVLLRSQSTSSQNGIWVWNGAATAMTRATDADSWDEVCNHWIVIQQGSEAGRSYLPSMGAVDGVIGTNSITYSRTFHPRVRAASTGNINTASPGATIDGVSLVAGNRVLLKNQTTQAQNGVYVWNGATTALTRSEDFNTWSELFNGWVKVEAGTANLGKSYKAMTLLEGGTLDTSPFYYHEIGSVKVSLLKKKTLEFRDCTLRYITPTQITVGLYLRGTYKAIIDNVHGENWNYPFIQTRGVFHPTITNSSNNHGNMRVDGSGYGPSNSVGYSINDQGSFGMQVTNWRVFGARSAYTTTASDGVEYTAGTIDQNHQLIGEPLHVHLNQCYARNLQSGAFGSHETGYMITYSNCVASNVYMGFQVRTRGVVMQNCQVWRSAHALLINARGPGLDTGTMSFDDTIVIDGFKAQFITGGAFLIDGETDDTFVPSVRPKVIVRDSFFQFEDSMNNMDNVDLEVYNTTFDMRKENGANGESQFMLTKRSNIYMQGCTIKARASFFFAIIVERDNARLTMKDCIYDVTGVGDMTFATSTVSSPTNIHLKLDNITCLNASPNWSQTGGGTVNHFVSSNANWTSIQASWRHTPAVGTSNRNSFYFKSDASASGVQFSQLRHIGNPVIYVVLTGASGTLTNVFSAGSFAGQVMVLVNSSSSNSVTIPAQSTAGVASLAASTLAPRTSKRLVFLETAGWIYE